MAMRRATASKGDAIINSLHALMDQLHRRVPGTSQIMLSPSPLFLLPSSFSPLLLSVSSFPSQSRPSPT